MRFLIDAQLPPALARWLSAQGYQADHVADFGLAAAADHAVWSHALAIDAVIVTKDADFAQRRIAEENGPAVVWLRLHNPRRRDLLKAMESILPSLLAALARGETLIEIV